VHALEERCCRFQHVPSLLEEFMQSPPHLLRLQLKTVRRRPAP
jgi:hypothetical protein